jgi:hypothetical protein
MGFLGGTDEKARRGTGPSAAAEASSTRYIMVDVVDVSSAGSSCPRADESAASRRASGMSSTPVRAEPKPAQLDYTTLHAIHAMYVDRSSSGFCSRIRR